MEVPGEPWMSDRVKVRESPVDGRGLFAIVPIEQGAQVARFGGRLVSDEALARLFDESPSYVDTLSVDDDANLVLPEGTVNGRGNHSCDPTLWVTSTWWLASRRPVAAGEELTVDYATLTDDPDFAMRCDCGTALCRGVVTGRDWALPALQRRYGDHWTRGLLRRVAESESTRRRP